MAIRVTLECGHASQLRSRTTPEGYTHDWEVFVRGVDNADIHHYVEKVVFYLHETFPKPKRVLKEPPFVVKESGYAGFIIPIHVYLKNKDEPKKFMIIYDLSLQQSGPAINKVVYHNEIINNPTDDFRRRLLRGGAVAVSAVEDIQDKGETKTPPMIGKPKLSGSEAKKHRLAEPKTSNSFADLFGPPIKTAKISPDGKKNVQPDRNLTAKTTIVSEKSDKVEKPIKTKDSPHKDGKREKTDERKDRRSKDHAKEKTKSSKEKSKRSCSPVSKRPSSPPVAISKRPSSPSLLPNVKRSSSPKTREKEPKKPALSERDKEREKEKEREREKEREKEKMKDGNKGTVGETSKAERKKDKKKHKEERDKEKREKSKEGERTSSKDLAKINDKKVEKVEKPEKYEKNAKELEYKLTSKDGRKSPKTIKDWESKAKEDKQLKSDKLEKLDKTDKPDKPKDAKSDKDRQKHKHKKRDKKEKRDGSKDREKKEKREKARMIADRHNADATPYLLSSTPLSTLLSELPERDTSDSAPSVDEDSFSESAKPTTGKPELDMEECSDMKLATRKDFDSTIVTVSTDAAMAMARTTPTPTSMPTSTPTTTTAFLPAAPTGIEAATTMAITASTTTTIVMNSLLPAPPTLLTELVKEKSDRGKKDKAKTNRTEEREMKKRKRRNDGRADEEQNIPTKREREKEKEREKDRNRGNSTSPLLEPVSSSQSPIGAAATTTANAVLEAESVHLKKDKGERSRDRTERSSERSAEGGDAEQVAPDSTNSTLAETEAIAVDPSVFSEDYVSQLKDLQQKIMTLQDNQELERVVQVIVETGQYEITNKSFDFDLCALDRRTVQRLQQFFSAS